MIGWQTDNEFGGPVCRCATCLHEFRVFLHHWYPRHCDWPREEFAAVTRYRFGLGTGYYSGVIVQETEFYDRLIADILQAAGIGPPITPPFGVEMSVRSGGGRTLHFLINHTEEDKTVTLPCEMHELLSQRTQAGPITLGRCGVSVFETVP